ncbi:hypothetical protein GOV10_02335 [Candidatus Woesearchaeota archaeon]|nr:hypothetical protein [Candidatus Woesearchaeota archaeon]
MKTIELTELIDDYNTHDMHRLEEIFSQTFVDEKKLTYIEYDAQSTITDYITTAIYEREGLTLTRRTRWSKISEFNGEIEETVLEDTLVLTGSKKEAEAYATFLDRMITGAYD